MTLTATYRVPAPATAPYTFGLFSAAVFPTVTDPHWQNGLEYEPAACDTAEIYGDPCRTDADGAIVPAGDKTFSGEVPLVRGAPFIVYAGFDCKLPGRALEERQALAERALALGEQRAVEHAYWRGDFDSPGLQQAGSENVLSEAGSPLSIVQGVAALECFLGESYGGRGVIHAPRGVSALASHRNLAFRNGQRLETAVGTSWAFGGGYCGTATGPDGAIAPAGTTWLYATGTVAIWRSEVFINPADAVQGFDPRTNDTRNLAERVYVVAHECAAAAVQISLSDC